MLQAMDLPFAVDLNNGAPNGVGYFQVTAAQGRRSNAADVFLRKVAAGCEIAGGDKRESHAHSHR
jgi:hypothetical protein